MDRADSRRRVQVHVPYPFLISRLGEILSAGINPEVYLDGAHLDRSDQGEFRLIRAEVEKYGARLTLHGPYIEMSPGHPDEERRLATVEKYERTFDAMELLRPTNVVFHAGYDERLFGGDVDLWLAQSLKTWPGLVERAEGLGVVIGLENIFEKTPASLKALMAEIDSSSFGVCLDAGHLNIFSRTAMEEWFSELGPRVAEVHIHDNNGRADEHLPVGCGSVDFVEFFSLVERYADDPVYTIEQHGEEDVEKGLRAVRRFL